MFRKKGENRFGLRAQMMMGLLLIFIVSGLILHWICERQLEQNRQAQITRELQTIRENNEIYVRQLLILNDANNDEESFWSLAQEMTEELKSSGIDALAVYANDGTLLAGEVEGKEKLSKEEDLSKALKGEAAFTMTYPEGKRLEVFFSMPVDVVGNMVGILRCRLDYTALWQQGQQMEETILRTAGLVFAAAFVLIAVFLNGILIPVGRLTKISRQMTQDLERNRINTELLSGLTKSERRDEIGELFRNYSVMLHRAGQYIGKIQDDRDRISELLQSRQEFYNNVTHELKTPLTTIQGYAQLLEADGGNDKELLQKGVTHILHESTRLHQMVVQLLEMADRNVIVSYEPVDMNRLIHSVAESMEIKANRYGCYIRLNLEETFYVSGAEERLRQVLINLLDNAVKYGQNDSQIQVLGRRCSEGILFCVENKTSEDLSSEELQHIFEPFYRADKEYSREQGSAGLGLSICRKIMKEHKGRIWAEKGAEGQVCFWLLFPEMEEER